MESLKELDRLIECAICHDHYTNPKALSCQHVYCKQCLQNLILMQCTPKTIECPQCRAITQLDEDDASMLPTDFFVNSLMDTYVRIKEACVQGERDYHKSKFADVVAPEAKEDIQGNLAPLQEICDGLSEAVTKVSECIAGLRTEEACVTRNIECSFEQLKAIIAKHQESLLTQTRQLVQTKLAKLSKQEERLKLALATTRSFISCVDATGKDRSDEEFLSMKKQISTRIQQLGKQFKEMEVQPSEAFDIAVQLPSRAKIEEICHKSAVIFTRSPNTTKTVEMDKDMELFVGTSGDEGIVTAKLKSHFDGSTATVLVRKEAAEPIHHLSFQPPQVRGFHELVYEKDNDSDVSGSPLRLFVRPPPVTQLGQPVKTVISKKFPHGVAVNKYGEVHVMEYNGAIKKISVCNYKGGVRTIDQSYGNSYGVAIDGDDNVYVTTGSTNYLQKFNRYGKQIKCVGGQGSKEGEFKYVKGVTIHGKQLYVCDEYNHRIQVFDLDLAFVRSFGGQGAGEKQFNRPYDISCDESGNMYIADHANNRVQVLDPKGQFLRQFTAYSNGEVRLSRPLGVHVANNHVFVSDFGNHRIVVFHSVSGEFVTSFGGSGSLGGHFKHPTGITTDHHGFLYVCDRDNDRVQIF